MGEARGPAIQHRRLSPIGMLTGCTAHSDRGGRGSKTNVDCNDAQHSPDKKRRLKDNNADAQQRHANLSPEQQVSERRKTTAYRQRQRVNLTTEQQENERRNNTASKQQQRANLTPEQQENERRNNTESRRRQRVQQVDNDDVRNNGD